MSRLSRALLAGPALLAVLLGGCGAGSGGELALDVSLDPDPPRVGASAVVLKALDADGAPLRGADVRIEANMDHAGMVPVFADARETAPGTYEARITFTMAGDWYLLVSAEAADGRELTGTVRVPGVQTDAGTGGGE